MKRSAIPILTLTVLALMPGCRTRPTTSSEQSSRESAPFSIAIVPSRSFASGISITAREKSPEPFYVVITNTTSQPQKTFEGWNGWGYKAVSFEVQTVDGQGIRISKKNQDFDKNFPSTFIVPAGDYKVYPIQLDDNWEIVPELKTPNGQPVKINIKAIYQLYPTPEAEEQGVWVGRIESKNYQMELYLQ